MHNKIYWKTLEKSNNQNRSANKPIFLREIMGPKSRYFVSLFHLTFCLFALMKSKKNYVQKLSHYFNLKCMYKIRKNWNNYNLNSNSLNSNINQATNKVGTFCSIYLLEYRICEISTQYRYSLQLMKCTLNNASLSLI